MMDCVIEVENLTKGFGGNLIFNNASMKIEKGKIYGVIGQNGCGKSILFKLICGLILPQTGKIIVNNEEITKGKFPKDIGVLLDSTGLLPNYSAFANLKSLAIINNCISNKEIEESILKVGLNPKEKKLVKNYSLGMKQKLGIAQAIMEKPALLLLDEPMNALDEESLKSIRKLLLSLNRENNVTIVLTSHNKEDIEELCDRVYKIENCKINEVSIQH